MTITGRTKVVGIIGHPVEHSLSPPMHNAEFGRLGLDWIYVPFPVAPDRLAEAMRGLAAAGVVGFNVTIPHKQSVMELLDEVLPEARLVGAVNTVRIDSDGRLFGTNTDVPGWVDDIQRDILLRGQTVCILGAGGAGRALAAAAAQAGAVEVLIVNRTLSAAEECEERLSPKFAQTKFRAAPLAATESPDIASTREQFQACEIVVNATSVGMVSGPDPAGSPVPTDWLNASQYVYDTVYAPADTPLLRAAAGRGCAVRNGLGMLARQGALAFEIWTGQRPDADRMEAILRKQLAERAARL